MRINVFYAEDNSPCCKIVGRFINKALQEYFSGADVQISFTLARSGIEAQRILEDNPANHFSLFFMDNNLDSGPSGMEIIGSLPKIGYNMSQVAIAAISGDLQESEAICAADIAKAKDLGYSYFLPKPTKFSDIQEAIRVMLPAILGVDSEKSKEESKDDNAAHADHEREVVFSEDEVVRDTLPDVMAPSSVVDTKKSKEESKDDNTTHERDVSVSEATTVLQVTTMMQMASINASIVEGEDIVRETTPPNDKKKIKF